MQTERPAGRWIGLLAVAALWLANGYWLVTQTGGSRGAVELRNSLLADVGDEGDFDWTPAQSPAGFRTESLSPPAAFAAAVGQARSAVTDHKTLSMALALAAHLQATQGQKGNPIMANTERTYERIRNTGEGYCADYTQVYNGIAYAAGVAVREWGIGFGGFGAGHAVSEVYLPEFGKWAMIDSFYSFYPADPATGEPLSVLEFRDRLDKSPVDVRVVPIVPEAYRFKSDSKLFDYFRRGSDHYFLWWGNDVLSYDRSMAVRLFGGVSRTLEQMAAIATGVHPRLRIVPEPGSTAEVRRLLDRRNVFAASAALFAVLSMVLLVLSVRVVRARRERS